MKDYSDMSAKEKVLHQFKRRICEDISVAYTDISLDVIQQGGTQTDVEIDMTSLGEIFFDIMHKESLQDLKRCMIGRHGWDDESFEDAFFTFMSR